MTLRSQEYSGIFSGMHFSPQVCFQDCLADASPSSLSLSFSGLRHHLWEDSLVCFHFHWGLIFVAVVLVQRIQWEHSPNKPIKTLRHKSQEISYTETFHDWAVFHHHPQCTSLWKESKLPAKRQIQSRTHITLQFLAFLGMLDLRTVSHTGELQSVSLLSVLFLHQIKTGYTKVYTILTFPKYVVFSKSTWLIERKVPYKFPRQF